MLKEAVQDKLDAEKRLKDLLVDHANLNNSYMQLATERPKLMLEIKDEQDTKNAMIRRVNEIETQAE